MKTEEEFMILKDALYLLKMRCKSQARKSINRETVAKLNKKIVKIEKLEKDLLNEIIGETDYEDCI